MNAIQPIRRALCLAALGVALTACNPPSNQGPTARPSSPSETAAIAAAQGDYSKATRLYMDAASATSDPQAQRRYRLQAGLAAAEGGDIQSANQLLNSLEPSSLDAVNQSLYNLARREISIANLAPSQALNQLPAPNASTYPEVAARVWSKRAALLFAANRPIEGLQALDQRASLLRDAKLSRANNNRTYDRALDAVGLGLGPDSRDAANAGQTVKGWLALANIGASGYANVDQRNQALAAWQGQYPGHPATRSVLADRFNYDAGSATLPIGTSQKPNQPVGQSGAAVRPTSETVALALPLSGKFQNAAQAIRDGFLFAYKNNSGGLPQPLIYDSNTMGAQQILTRAQQDNAGVLVGPLDKAKVSAIAALQTDLPEVALNYIDGPVNRPGFYQFALSPEDEAAAAARHAHQKGYSTAVALVPQGDWGNRVLDAFRQQVTSEGGQLVKSASYNSDAHDHSRAIQQVLSGTSPDFVFVAAQPNTARLIRSQLKYYHAMNLPMISTSHAYTGQRDADKDIDLNDVYFVDMPWIVGTGPTVARLRQQAEQQFGSEVTSYARLFAMGMDAWLLTRKIERQGLESGDALEGMTGILSVEPNNRIERYLAWAVFRNGVAQLQELPSTSDVGTRSGGYSPGPAPTQGQIQGQMQGQRSGQAPRQLSGQSGNSSSKTSGQYIQPGPSTHPGGNY